MNNIQMVDLQTQYENIKIEIDKAIKDVISSTAFIKGKVVSDFEFELSKYLSINNVISCGSGTDALQIALMAIDIKPGDEVITTPFTFVATVEVIALLGAKPVFVDVLPDTFNINPDQVSKAITARTKAIIPVHIFGQSAEMDLLLEIANKNNIYVVEDAAQSIGASYKGKSVGTLGHIGTTSFFPSKNLGCYGDGGALFTNDDNLSKRITVIANHGQNKRYFYDEIGVNSRLDSIQAAILKVKLKYLNKYINKRKKAAAKYDKAFSKSKYLQIPFCNPNSTHVYHQYTLKVKKGRDSLQKFLTQKNIPSAIYYPVPLHLQKAYKIFGFSFGDFPIAEELSTKVLSLPMHTELTQSQLDYISDKVLEYFVD